MLHQSCPSVGMEGAIGDNFPRLHDAVWGQANGSTGSNSSFISTMRASFPIAARMPS